MDERAAGGTSPPRLCEPFNIGRDRGRWDGHGRAIRPVPNRGRRESVFEAIERACRFRAVLPLSDGNGGGLILGGPSRSRTVCPASARREYPIGQRHGDHGWRGSADYTLLGPAGGWWRSFHCRAEEVAHVSCGGTRRWREPLSAAHDHRRAISGQRRSPRRASSGRPTCSSARARSVRDHGAGLARGAGRADLWEPGPHSCSSSDEWLGISSRHCSCPSTAQSLSSASGTLTTLEPGAAGCVRAACCAEQYQPAWAVIWWELAISMIRQRSSGLSRELRRRVHADGGARRTDGW